MPQSQQADARIAELAGRQRGYVTRKQLLALGESRDAIDYRVKVGRLISDDAGVPPSATCPKTPWTGPSGRFWPVASERS